MRPVLSKLIVDLVTTANAEQVILQSVGVVSTCFISDLQKQVLEVPLEG